MSQQPSPVLLPPAEACPPLVATLRDWRAQRAREDDVPPYIVLTNATLLEVAARRPVGLEQLASLKGVGPARLKRYGEQIVEIVRQAPASDPALLEPADLRVGLPFSEDGSSGGDGAAGEPAMSPFTVCLEYCLSPDHRDRLARELSITPGDLARELGGLLLGTRAEVRLRLPPPAAF